MIRPVFVFVFVIVCLISCTQEDTSFEGTTPVTFNLQAQGLTPMTRAAVMPIGTPSCLIILDYMDGQLKGTYTRGTGSEDIDNNAILSSITLPLAQGSHTLYFLCAQEKWDALDKTNHTISWTTTDLKQVWATSLSLEVTELNQVAQPVQMNLCVGAIIFPFDDVMAPTCSTAEFSLSKSSWTYDYIAGTGTEGTMNKRTFDATEKRGKSNVVYYIYSFVPSDATEVDIKGTKAKNIGTATVFVKDEEGNYIGASKAPVTIPDVGILPGYQTNLLGNFWLYKPPFSLSIQDTWSGQFDISY